MARPALRQRDDAVFQLSLTELAFTIAFLLLMLLGVRISQTQAEADSARAALERSPGASEASARLDRARAGLEGALRTAGAADPAQMLTRLVDAQDARAERDRLRLRVKELDARLSALAAAQGVSSAMQPALGGFEGEAGVPLPAGSASARAGTGLAAASAAAAAAPGASAVDREARNLRGQVAYLSQRLAALPGHGGRDYPPCWADAAGHVEFLFAVELRPGAIVLAPAWPPRRDLEARALPGLDTLTREPMTPETFVTRMQPLAEWSHSRTPECRHYVQLRSTIADAVESDRARLRVERYFYKTEAPR